tara:strand:+ start:856 stop:2046 length:1191 start_codon:yes stop_codon:yes gene_type:complete
MAEEIIQKQMQLLPEYQEKYLKDLLANVFQYDEETGEISGIASRSPLYGDPVLDDAGEQMFVAEDGSYTSDVNMSSRDQYGEPILAVEGGVAAPDVMRFTDAQVDAIRRMTGYTDPETGEVVYEGMMGSYQPFVDSAQETFEKGVGIAERAGTARFDPQGQIVYDTVTNEDGTTSQVPRTDAEGNVVREGGYKDFYDPFVEDVIDASKVDFQEALAAERNRLNKEASGLGAFGRRADTIYGSAVGKSAAEEAKLGAQLRSQAFTGAQQQAQSAFENQQNRGMQAGQLFQGLGTGIGALGESVQGLGFQDINTLFNVGQLEQKQLQSEYDAQRAGQLEEAYEPFARFSYMRDILSGVPASGTGLTATGTPSSSSTANIMTNQNVYSALNKQGLGGLI